MSQNLINSLTDDVSALRADVSRTELALAASGAEVDRLRALNAENVAVIRELSEWARDMIYMNDDSAGMNEARERVRTFINDTRAEHRAKQEQNK